jgi:hypothetical protein
VMRRKATWSLRTTSIVKAGTSLVTNLPSQIVHTVRKMGEKFEYGSTQVTMLLIMMIESKDILLCTHSAECLGLVLALLDIHTTEFTVCTVNYLMTDLL